MNLLDVKMLMLHCSVVCLLTETTFFCRKLVTKEGSEDWHLTYNWAGDLLAVRFQPQHICMLPDTGIQFKPTS